MFVELMNVLTIEAILIVFAAIMCSYIVYKGYKEANEIFRQYEERAR